MKKSTLTLFAALLLSASAYGQGFYFRAGLGYAFPMAGQTLEPMAGDLYNGTRSSSTFLQTYSMKNTSFSAGLQGGIGLGYMFSPNVGLQLDVNAGISNRKYAFQDKNVLVDLGAGAIQSNITITKQADLPVLLAPSLVLQTSGKGKVNIYSRVGPVIPLATQIIQNTYIENVPGTGAPSSYNFTFAIKSSFSMGFSAAGGLQYKLGNKVSLWAEVSMLSMSLYMKQSDLTGFEHDGRSYSLSNVTSPHTYYYSKSGTLDSNSVTLPTYSHPFSNLGVNMGIRISMGGRSRRGGASADAADRREMSKRPKAGKFR
jgi:hypothetical protein